MKRNANHGFDEVMIVNPYDPNAAFGQGVTLMPYHYGNSSAVGYYGDGGYGYYAQPPEMSGGGEPPFYGEYAPMYGEQEPVGYYAEPEPYGYYAQPEYAGYGPVGYVGEEPYGQAGPYGYYGEYEPMGYYAEEPYGSYGEYEPVGYYAEEPYGSYGEYEPVGYYAETEPYGYYGEPEYAGYAPMGYYGEMPEMVGYGAEPFEYPGASYYGEPEISGYVRDGAPTFNAGCPVPTNVAGYGEPEHFEGYVRPGEVSPTCGNFTPQPGPTAAVPDTFRPLWE